MDEPLSNLDAQLRLQARAELVRIHNLYQSTLVYVTHDQVEAMTVGQRIAIMNKGILQQLDTPDIIYQHPANTFVAAFIGSPPMNLLSGQFHDGAVWIAGNRIDLPNKWQLILAQHPESWLGIRPEYCQLSDTPYLKGEVELIENLGGQRCIHVRLVNDGQRVLCIIPRGHPIPDGEVGLGFHGRMSTALTEKPDLT